MDFKEGKIILLGLGTMFFLLKREKFKIEPIVLITLTLIQTLIGLSFIEVKDINCLKFYFGILCLLIGYFLGNKKKLKEKENKNVQNKKKLYILEIIVIFFVIYHFIVGGIPIFSSNVEISRFSFTSSGLYGIPGRIYLYGLPYIYGLIYLQYDTSNKYSRKNLLFITGIFVLARMLGGIKSGVLEVLNLYILLRYATEKTIKLKELLRKRNIILYFLIIFFIYKLTKSYKTMEDINVLQFFEYILKRITTIQAMPLDAIFKVMEQKINLKANWYNDLLYFISKYSKLFNFHEYYFTLDNRISAYIYKTPLLKSSFLVPITMSGFGELYINFHDLVYIFMVIVGAFYGKCLNMVRNINYTIYLRSKIIFTIIMLEGFITKGGLAYGLINTIAMLMIFIIFEKIAEKISYLGVKK